MSSQANVTVNVRNGNPLYSIIDIQGEINGYAEATLMEALMKASSNNVRNIIFNFENLEYMNSSGIGVLVTLLIRVKRQNQRLLAYGLSEHYRQIFELTAWMRPYALSQRVRFAGCFELMMIKDKY
jgi:anti-sigma B factor antagonist